VSSDPLPLSRDDIMRRTDFSGGAVLDDRLWIHGGYVGYDNGTKSGAPSML